VCSVEQDASAGQLNSCEEISGEFVVACGDGTKVLEFIEEPLDEVTFAIEREVTRSWGLAVGLWRDHWSDCPLGQRADQLIRVVGLVGDQGIRVGGVNERLGASQIVSLPGCKHQVDGIAQSIDERVDFGGQSAAGSADRLRAIFFRAPALCW
jgi:hypothetical protein